MKSKRLTKVTGDTIIRIEGPDPYAYIYTTDLNLRKYLTQVAEPFTYDDEKQVNEWKLKKSCLMFSESKSKASTATITTDSPIDSSTDSEAKPKTRTRKTKSTITEVIE